MLIMECCIYYSNDITEIHDLLLKYITYINSKALNVSSMGTR